MNAASRTENLIERGQSIFEAQIEARLTGQNPDDFLLIDVLSSDYEVASDEISGRSKLRARRPDAIVYLRRVGDEAAYTVGGGYQE